MRGLRPGAEDDLVAMGRNEVRGLKVLRAKVPWARRDPNTQVILHRGQGVPLA